LQQTGNPKCLARTLDLRFAQSRVDGHRHRADSSTAKPARQGLAGQLVKNRDRPAGQPSTGSSQTPGLFRHDRREDGYQSCNDCRRRKAESRSGSSFGQESTLRNWPPIPPTRNLGPQNSGPLACRAGQFARVRLQVVPAGASGPASGRWRLDGRQTARPGVNRRETARLRLPVVPPIPPKTDIRYISMTHHNPFCFRKLLVLRKPSIMLVEGAKVDIWAATGISFTTLENSGYDNQQLGQTVLAACRNGLRRWTRRDRSSR
jgi:hypothetical protein